MKELKLCSKCNTTKSIEGDTTECRQCFESSAEQENKSVCCGASKTMYKFVPKSERTGPRYKKLDESICVKCELPFVPQPKECKHGFTECELCDVYEELGIESKEEKKECWHCNSAQYTYIDKRSKLCPECYEEFPNLRDSVSPSTGWEEELREEFGISFTLNNISPEKCKDAKTQIADWYIEKFKFLLSYQHYLWYNHNT